ncbi:MAG: metalloregulator ArsR/SmtB family transcription factor [Firmicutes bacterium]|nr:metalloregulator ArsR/SmtB family transcription factor [Bacillota bacterium]
MSTKNTRTLFFRAMSDPTRQKILSLLEKREKMCVSDLVRGLRVSQPTVSKHLAMLRNADLVLAERAGQQVYYSINDRHMRECCTSYFSMFSCCSDLFSGSDVDEQSLE